MRYFQKGETHMTHQQDKGRIIKMSRADYRHFVVNKFEDTTLLNKIAEQQGPPELICEVSNHTWERFCTDRDDYTITNLRLQMKIQLWNIDEDRATTDPMVMMKYWVTEALERRGEELTGELAITLSLVTEVNNMTDVNELIPHFVREAGFLHDKDQESIVSKTIALLHPELF
jgi:hypothetical protein